MKKKLKKLFAKALLLSLLSFSPASRALQIENTNSVSVDTSLNSGAEIKQTNIENSNENLTEKESRARRIAIGSVYGFGAALYGFGSVLLAVVACLPDNKPSYALDQTNWKERVMFGLLSLGTGYISYRYFAGGVANILKGVPLKDISDEKGIPTIFGDKVNKS